MFELVPTCDVLPMLLEECSSIIAGERWPELTLIYGLVKSDEEKLSHVIRQFKEYIAERGDILIKILPHPGLEGSKFSDEFVNSISSFHIKYIELINKNFDGNSDLIQTLEKTCRYVINHNPNPKTLCPSLELVCLFVCTYYYFICRKFIKNFQLVFFFFYS